MSYEIKNNYTVLNLTLTTTQSNYDDLVLNIYLNDSSTITDTIDDPTITSETIDAVTYHYLKFKIHSKDYDVGDAITKFELTVDGSTHLWETSEGIKWLLDGEEYEEITLGEGHNNTIITDTFHTNTLSLSFRDAGSHTMEAVYVGNGSLKTATTGKYAFMVKQPALNETGSLENDGAYKIEFLDKNLSTLTYMDGKKIYFRLTKGGVPVPNRTIEMVTPTYTSSHDTNEKGMYWVENNNWECGKYKIGAYYNDETTNKVITTTYKEIEVKKGTPTFTDNFADEGTFIKGSKYKATIKYSNTPIANEKLSVYINGKLTTLTTNNYGSIYYAFKSKGTYAFKIVYKGDKNHKKVEHERTITIES